MGLSKEGKRIGLSLVSRNLVARKAGGFGGTSMNKLGFCEEINITYEGGKALAGRSELAFSWARGELEPSRFRQRGVWLVALEQMSEFRL